LIRHIFAFQTPVSEKTRGNGFSVPSDAVFDSARDFLRIFMHASEKQIPFACK
jgi:hypothetical protein